MLCATTFIFKCIFVSTKGIFKCIFFAVVGKQQFPGSFSSRSDGYGLYLRDTTGSTRYADG